MTKRKGTPGDPRLWASITIDLLSNPKVSGLAADAKWLYVAGILTSRRDLSDGFIRAPVVCVDQDIDMDMAEVLVNRGLWHRHDHKCPDCPQPEVGRGWVYIHDYLDHQSSREQVEAFRTLKSQAGKKGATKRWEMAGAKADAMAGAKADANPDAKGNGIAQGQGQGEKLGPSLSTSNRQSVTREISDDDLAKITALTGGGPAHARKTIEFVLGKIPSPPRDPLAYVLAAVANEPDAYRYRRGNPHTADDWCPEPGHEGEWGDACRQCALDRKLGIITPGTHALDDSEIPPDDIDWTDF